MKHTEYKPDCWAVIKILGDDPHYRVMGGWSGGYATGDSWRMNSGIVSVEEDGEHLLFEGYSGSVYKVHKESYGLKMSTVYVWKALKERHGSKVELMDEDTDWFSLDWILK